MALELVLLLPTKLLGFMVDELIKMHNGTLDIQSKLGIGTTVTIALPVEVVEVHNEDSLINEIIGEDVSDV